LKQKLSKKLTSCLAIKRIGIGKIRVIAGHHNQKAANKWISTLKLSHSIAPTFKHQIKRWPNQYGREQLLKP
jgi:hypothetical protein